MIDELIFVLTAVPKENENTATDTAATDETTTLIIS